MPPSPSSKRRPPRAPAPKAGAATGGATDLPDTESQLLEQQVAAVRRFNRFYTRQIGVLQEGLLHSPFSPTEARVLYELAQREETTASALGRELGLDAGYLSRIVQGFERRGLLRRQQSKADARQTLLRLSPAGRERFDEIDRRSREEVRALLGGLTTGDRRRALDAMRTVESLLGGQPADRAPYLLRTHEAGDLGWILQRHAVLYAREYGWDERFERLVARIIADFLETFDPRRERCWIAERNGENVGSVLLARKSATVAQLRLLLVEPSARGLGIGRRLVSECTRFARQAGYAKIVLWTNDVLEGARRLYEAEGYHLVSEERHARFGPEVVGQTWELPL
ncbi:MAG: GNAT family N-acetyltransferase [Gemmatimonadaceae bacterium]